MMEEIDRQLHALVQEGKAAHLPDLPAPGIIWWRAQLMERRRLQAKALRPILILRGASVGAIYACVVELGYALMRSAQLNLPAALIAGSLFAATHVGALSIYLSLSTKAK